MAAWDQYLLHLRAPHHTSDIAKRIFLSGHPTCLHWDNRRPAYLPFCVPPSQYITGVGILTYFPFAYAYKPQLRSRLPQGWQALPWKPWTSGERDSHPLFRYSFLHSHLWYLQCSFRYTFTGLHNALLPIYHTVHSTASVYILAPLHCRRRDSRPVSYYALFKCMAASKPTSWLSVNLHLLSHLDIIWDLSWWSGLFPSRPRILLPMVSLLFSGSTVFGGWLVLVSGTPPRLFSALPPQINKQGCT